MLLGAICLDNTGAIYYNNIIAFEEINAKVKIIFSSNSNQSYI